MEQGDGLESTVDAVRDGHEEAFGALVERHRRELQVHCYRMLGSFEDAEDLVQETFLRAWRRRGHFEGSGTFRAWLYRIATNACLDFLDRHPRRPRPRQVSPSEDGAGVQPPVEVAWLQPYPDHLLDAIETVEEGPERTVVARETIELAFLTAIQHLPPRQRAVLILRDVLEWSTSDTAALLETSVPAVKSMLQRARSTMKAQLPPRRVEWSTTSDPSVEEQFLLQRYMEAHERADVTALAGILRDDVLLTMPPHPMWFGGRESIMSFTAEVFDPGSEMYHGAWRGLPTRANRQPAVAWYVRRPGLPLFRAQVLDVLRVEAGKIVEIMAFVPALFPSFGLPMTF